MGRPTSGAAYELADVPTEAYGQLFNPNRAAIPPEALTPLSNLLAAVTGTDALKLVYIEILL